MKLLHGGYADAEQRARLLAAFERSGLSAAAFTRKHGLTYTTFCGWRNRAGTPSAFVQVDLPANAPVAELVIDLDANARLRLIDPAQIPLAAQLVQALHAKSPCFRIRRSGPAQRGDVDADRELPDARN